MSIITSEETRQQVNVAAGTACAGSVRVPKGDEVKEALRYLAEYHSRMLENASEARAELGPPPELPEALRGKTMGDLLAVPDDEYFDWEPKRLYFNLEPVEDE